MDGRGTVGEAAVCFNLQHLEPKSGGVLLQICLVIDVSIANAFLTTL